jgi:hypothetical protein
MTSSLEFLFNGIAGLLIIVAQLTYIIQVVRRSVVPSLLSWLGWALLMGTSLFSQTVEIGWSWTLLPLLISTSGCFLIFIYSLAIKNFNLSNYDWPFLVLGVVCILLYFVFSDPWLTTIFAIFADFILGIPTIIKAIKYPITEKSRAWIFALMSWAITLMSSTDEPLIYLLFPIYLFLFNGLMFVLTFKISRSDNRWSSFFLSK